MLKTISTVVFLAAIAFALPASALSQTECQGNWGKMDPKGNGFVAGSKAKPYIAMMKKSKMKMENGSRLNQDEYMNACITDIFLRAQK
jgi:hypothetical protein